MMKLDASSVGLLIQVFESTSFQIALMLNVVLEYVVGMLPQKTNMRSVDRVAGSNSNLMIAAWPKRL